MNPKTTVVLVIALLLAVGGIWLAQPAPKPMESVETGPTPLLTMKSEDVTGYEIKQGEQSVCTFVKQDNKWRMTSPMAGLAETFAINGEISKLVGLKYPIAYDPGAADRPGDEITSLSKPFRIVKLTDAAGKSVVIRIGDRVKLSHQTYVQIEGDPRIYAVDADLNTDFKKNPRDYRGRRIGEYKVANAVRVQVSGSENYTLVKSEAGWTIEEPFKARADLQQVNKILNAMNNMGALAFVDDEPKSLRPYGLENPRLTVTILLEEKTPRQPPDVEGPTSEPATIEYDIKTSSLSLALGGVTEDRVFARMLEPASPMVFQITETLLKDFNPKLTDLRDKKIAATSPERAARIRLVAGTDAVTLVRRGGQWMIAAGADDSQVEPAEFAAADDLIKTLRDMKALGFEESETPSFGLAAPRASVEVSIEGQTSPLKLLVGGQTPSKTGVYIKNETENFIAVVPAAAADALMARPVSFRGRDILMFDQSNAVKIDISGGEETRTLEKVGPVWKMTAPVAGDAAEVPVATILADLSALRGRRAVADASEASQYGLTDGAITATVTLQSPAPAASQPDSQPTSQPVQLPPPVLQTVRVARHGGLVYAMKPGAATIYEVDAKVADDLAAEFLKTTVFQFETSLCYGISFGGAESFTFEKKEDAWRLAGEATFSVDPAKITTLLNALRDVKAVRFVKYAGANPAEFGLDKPALSISLQDEGGANTGITVSQRSANEGGRYASTAADPGRVFVLRPDDFTKLSKKVTDFQKAP